MALGQLGLYMLHPTVGALVDVLGTRLRSTVSKLGNIKGCIWAAQASLHQQEWVEDTLY